jgi:hypothetical protein
MKTPRQDNHHLLPEEIANCLSAVGDLSFTTTKSSSSQKFKRDI